MRRSVTTTSRQPAKGSQAKNRLRVLRAASKASESGYLKGRGMRVALDTTNILGRGAVKDTYNLLADGMVKLLRALAAVEKTADREWAKARGYERYLGSSMKGEAAIDWSHKRARKPLLAAIVRDARPAPGIVAAGAGALA